MKLTAADFAVVFDTLRGATNGCAYSEERWMCRFQFNATARRQVLEKIEKQLIDKNFTIETQETTK